MKKKPSMVGARTYTPGPWRVSNTEIGIWVIAPEKQIVGLPGYPSYPQEILEAGSYPEKLGDAQLVAAAPMMYAALKAAIACGMVPVSSAKEGGASAHSEQVKVADKIREAIAYAEQSGEELMEVVRT